MSEKQLKQYLKLLKLHADLLRDHVLSELYNPKAAEVVDLVAAWAKGEE